MKSEEVSTFIGSIHINTVPYSTSISTDRIHSFMDFDLVHENYTCWWPSQRIKCMYTGPVPPVRPVRPWLYRFLRRKNCVAGILTYDRVAIHPKFLPSFLLGFRRSKPQPFGQTSSWARDETNIHGMETGLTRRTRVTATFKQRDASDVPFQPTYIFPFHVKSETVTEAVAVQCKAQRCYGEAILITEK